MPHLVSLGILIVCSALTWYQQCELFAFTLPCFVLAGLAACSIALLVRAVWVLPGRERSPVATVAWTLVLLGGYATLLLVDYPTVIGARIEFIARRSELERRMASIPSAPHWGRSNRDNEVPIVWWNTGESAQARSGLTVVFLLRRGWKGCFSGFVFSGDDKEPGLPTVRDEHGRPLLQDLRCRHRLSANWFAVIGGTR